MIFLTIKYYINVADESFIVSYLNSVLYDIIISRDKEAQTVTYWFSVCPQSLRLRFAT